MGSRYSFTSSQLQFVTGLPKFERRFSGLLVIAGTNYQLSKADLIRDSRTPPLRGQLVPFPFHMHVVTRAWVLCRFTNLLCSPGACVYSSCLPVNHVNTLSLNFSLCCCLILGCFLGHPMLPVLPQPPLPPSFMLEASQGAAFHPEPPNDLEICLFYKLPLRLDETHWHHVDIGGQGPGQYT